MFLKSHGTGGQVSLPILENEQIQAATVGPLEPQGIVIAAAW